MENSQRMLMKDFMHPTRTLTPSCIEIPSNFPQHDFKPSIIRLLPTFFGLETENPYVHIREFEEVVTTFHNHPDIVDSIKLKLFPFSLKDKAKSWLYSLRPRSIKSWKDMTSVFFHKYFPYQKTTILKKQILTFSQNDHENFYEAWERFKDLLSQCPHHGYENWRLVSFFYEGLLSHDRQYLEVMCNGKFLHKDPEEAKEFLDEFAEKVHLWAELDISQNTNKSRSIGIHQSKEEDNYNLRIQVEYLTREIEILKAKNEKGSHEVTKVELKGTNLVNESFDQQPLDHQEAIGEYEEQWTNHKPYTPYPETFNFDGRNDLDRWNSTQEQSFGNQWRNEEEMYSRENVPQRESHSSKSLEETLQAFMEMQKKSCEKMEAALTLMTKEISKRSSQPMVISEGQNVTQTFNFEESDEEDDEEVSHVTTCSGKTLEKSNTTDANAEEEEEEEEEEEVNEFPAKAPIPQDLHLTRKVSENHEHILEHLELENETLTLSAVDFKEDNNFDKHLELNCCMNLIVSDFANLEGIFSRDPYVVSFDTYYGRKPLFDNCPLESGIGRSSNGKQFSK